MQSEKVCPIHGPYASSHESCPRCSNNAGKNRPGKPTPLYDDDLETDVSRGRPASGDYGGDDPTEISPSRRSKGAYAGSLDDEEKTELGLRHKVDDETEFAENPAVCEAILWVKEGERRGKIYRLRENSTIGRKEGEVILDDPKVSNPHAKIALRDESYIIVDILSKNGTFVNDERIASEKTLVENDLIKIGDTVFVLKIL